MSCLDTCSSYYSIISIPLHCDVKLQCEPEPFIFAYRSSRATPSSFEKWHLQSSTFPRRMKFVMCLYLLRFTARLFFISSNVTFWHTLFIISTDELIPRKASIFLIWLSASWIRSSNCMNSILGLSFSAHHASLKSNQSPQMILFCSKSFKYSLNIPF